MSPPLYILDGGQRLEVFGDPVAEARIADVPLRTWQRSLGASLGLAVHVVTQLQDVPRPALVMDGDVFCTLPYFTRFVEQASVIQHNVQAGLRHHQDLDAMVGAQVHDVVKGGYTFGLRHLVDDGPIQPLLLSMDDPLRARSRVPAALHPHGVAVTPQSATAILHVRAPLHLLTANWHQLLALMDARLPRFGFQKRKALLRGEVPNTVGPYCDVHHTAVVENSTLGAAVMVGPHAVIRNSVVGDGAQVLEGAVVLGAVIGAGAMVSHQYRVIRSVMYPESAVVTGALQFSLLGRAAAVFAAWITDVRMDHGTIRTPVGGVLRDSGLSYLGVTLGHGARLTAGTISAPGRVVPNGVAVHPDPATVYSAPPDANVSTVWLRR